MNFHIARDLTTPFVVVSLLARVGVYCVEVNSTTVSHLKQFIASKNTIV